MLSFCHSRSGLKSRTEDERQFLFFFYCNWQQRFPNQIRYKDSTSGALVSGPGLVEQRVSSIIVKPHLFPNLSFPLDEPFRLRIVPSKSQEMFHFVSMSDDSHTLHRKRSSPFSLPPCAFPSTPSITMRPRCEGLPRDSNIRRSGSPEHQQHGSNRLSRTLGGVQHVEQLHSTEQRCET